MEAILSLASWRAEAHQAWIQQADAKGSEGEIKIGMYRLVALLVERRPVKADVCRFEPC